MSDAKWWQIIPGYQLAPLEGHDDVFLSNALTPAYSFTTLAAEMRGGAFVTATARDSFSLDLGLAVIAEVRRREAVLDTSANLTLIEGFKPAGYGFDAIAVMGPQVHRRFHTNPSIHDRTVDVAPVFHCEFFPGDSAAVIREVVKSCVCVVDWNRKPAPRIWTRYFDAKLQIGTRGKRPGLISLPRLVQLVESVIGNAGSWLKLANWRGAMCHCDFSSREVVIEVDSVERIVVANEEFPAWLSDFISCDRARPR